MQPAHAAVVVTQGHEGRPVWRSYLRHAVFPASDAGPIRRLAAYRAAGVPASKRCTHAHFVSGG
jgi:hypothetical protein